MSELDLLLDHPLFGVVATVAAYLAADHAWRRYGSPAVLHPVLIATFALSVILLFTGLSYQTYFGQASILNEALGVVIVLLAVPLTRQARLISEAGWPLLVSLVGGSCVAIVTALFLPWVLGAGDDLMATLSPKSTTAAVAVELSARLGGSIGMTAVVVISTGIFGAIFGPAILDTLSIDDDRARGFALGVASHATGTARAFQMSDVAGAFASLGMILNALLTIALVALAMALI